MNRELCIALLLPTLACDSGAQPLALDAPTAEATPGEANFSLRNSQLLSQLGQHQSHALCREAAARIDLCTVAGRREGNPRLCEAAVSSCRAAQPGPSTDCRDARFDFPEPCSASAGDYLACVDAWNKSVSCTFDTFDLDRPPEECLPLLQKCPYLESEFGPAVNVVPRCDVSSSPVRVDDDDDIVGLDCGRPVPTRMVTLGDSIAACFVGADYSSCSPTLVSEYLREHYAPRLDYQSFAFPGALTSGVLAQAMNVASGPGHLLVWIYVGGNDLASCQLPNLAEAQACIDTQLAALPAQWEQIFAYFNDAARFPDGVTFMTNTQYSLWDQCTHPRGPERGLFAETSLQRFGRDVILQPARDRPNVVAIDQYPDFLGHAGNADRRGCPHCYRDDNTVWLFDGTHPNDRGSKHIADKWKGVLDRLYSGSCQ